MSSSSCENVALDPRPETNRDPYSFLKAGPESVSGSVKINTDPDTLKKYLGSFLVR